MLLSGGELHSATDEVLVGAIPSNAKWNWVGCYHISNKHRVIKNELVEEHFITTDDPTNVYFKIVYGDFPIVSEAIRIELSSGTSGTAVTMYNYITTSIANVNVYLTELYAILNATNLKTTQLLSFINKYMRNINVTN